MRWHWFLALIVMAVVLAVADKAEAGRQCFTCAVHARELRAAGLVSAANSPMIARAEHRREHRRRDRKRSAKYHLSTNRQSPTANPMVIAKRESFHQLR